AEKVSKRKLCEVGCRIPWYLWALVWTGVALLFQGCFNQPPKHGTELQVEVDLTGVNGVGDQQRAIASTAEALRKRLNRFGANFTLRSEGTNRLVIRIGSATNAMAFRRLLERPGRLELALVHERNIELVKSNQAAEPGYRRLTAHREINGHVLTEIYF